MNSPAADKISLIEKSLRHFVFGILSLIPILGLPFAVLVLVLAPKWASDPKKWNPARRYLVYGKILALFGILITLIIGGLIIKSIADAAGSAGGDE